MDIEAASISLPVFLLLAITLIIVISPTVLSVSDSKQDQRTESAVYSVTLSYPAPRINDPSVVFQTYTISLSSIGLVIDNFIPCTDDIIGEYFLGEAEILIEGLDPEQADANTQEYQGQDNRKCFFCHVGSFQKTSPGISVYATGAVSADIAAEGITPAAIALLSCSANVFE